MLQTLLAVAAGGAIGASGRYLVNVGAGRIMGIGFPYGTVAVNVIGSFLMGVLFVVLARKRFSSAGRGVRRRSTWCCRWPCPYWHW